MSHPNGVVCFVCQKVKHPVGPVDAWWTCGLCRQGQGLSDEWTPQMRERVAAQRLMARLCQLQVAIQVGQAPPEKASARYRRAVYAYWREVDPNADVPALKRIAAGLNAFRRAMTPNDSVGQARMALVAWQATQP